MRNKEQDSSSTSAPASSMGFWRRAVDLYVDGFRGMGPLGRKLWLLIAIKVIVLLVLMKILFFPNLLSRDYDNDADRADAVRQSMVDPLRSE